LRTDGLLHNETTMVDEAQLRQLASRLWLSKNCYDMTAAAELWQLRKEINAEALESERLAALKALPHR
jgi:hypothetical protein